MNFAQLFLAASLLAPTKAADPSIWKLCRVESSQLCGPAGCSGDRKADLAIYVGSYIDEDGKRGSYSHRCKADARAPCTRVENVEFGFEPHGYSVWTSPMNGTMTRMSADGTMTDVMAENAYVLILRGTCADAPPPVFTNSE